MDNRFEQVYEHLDAKLLRGAENAVHAWNWTTGRTKSDLANILLAIAPCCETSFWLMEYAKSSSPLYLTLTISVGLGMGATSLGKIVHNTAIEKREEDALRKGCLDPLAEENKENSRSESESYGAWGAMLSTATLVPGAPIGVSLAGAGFFMRAYSAYIMRVSNPPPRQDCISRGIDHLKKGLESLTEKQPRPTYAPA